MVYQHLEAYDLEDRCDINRIPDATVEDVFDAVEKWHRRKDLVLFHYGGHATGATLLLSDQEANSLEANAEGLARLLGSIPSLKLVFLNACSTKDQVQLLFKHGVKAVIATSKPVEDKMAVDLADRFYQNLAAGETIGSSFERARDFVLTKYKKQDILAARETRDLVFDNFSEIVEGQDLPWGLYHQAEAEDILKWSLPQQVTIKSRFGKVDKYACDRFEQNSRFKTNFLTNRGEQKVQFYFIHGEEKQSPRGLFRRFVLEHLETAYHQTFDKVVNVEESYEMDGAKINLLSALFKAVELEPNRFKHSELTMASLLKAPTLREKECIAIQFKVYSTAWKPFTKDLLTWFIWEFAKSSELGPGAPDFLFFFSVIYEEEKKGGMFSRMLKKSPKEKILKVLKQFPQIEVLKELPPVLKKDINQWMDRITDVYDEKQQHLEQYFPDKEEWEMATVEKILGNIIKIHSNKPHSE